MTLYVFILEIKSDLFPQGAILVRFRNKQFFRFFALEAKIKYFCLKEGKIKYFWLEGKK